MSAIDDRGHLFARFAGDGIEYCVGCGHPKGSPEASPRCTDAEGLAADMEAQALLGQGLLAALK